ncbi:MAG: hypothetical protein ACTSWP_01970 [Candidatus Freyarchaeota archaeon]|nr:hypothetical protein [Candidatus Freyrarchaeum guaymaensis]
MGCCGSNVLWFKGACRRQVAAKSPPSITSAWMVDPLINFSHWQIGRGGLIVVIADAPQPRANIEHRTGRRRDHAQAKKLETPNKRSRGAYSPPTQGT